MNQEQLAYLEYQREREKVRGGAVFCCTHRLDNWPKEILTPCFRRTVAAADVWRSKPYSETLGHNGASLSGFRQQRTRQGEQEANLSFPLLPVSGLWYDSKVDHRQDEFHHVPEIHLEFTGRPVV